MISPTDCGALCSARTTPQPSQSLVEPLWNPGEPWWNPRGTLPQDRPGAYLGRDPKASSCWGKETIGNITNTDKQQEKQNTHKHTSCRLSELSKTDYVRPMASLLPLLPNASQHNKPTNQQTSKPSNKTDKGATSTGSEKKSTVTGPWWSRWSRWRRVTGLATFTFVVPI